jgi:hypothetical protein
MLEGRSRGLLCSLLVRRLEEGGGVWRGTSGVLFAARGFLGGEGIRGGLEVELGECVVL